MNCVNIDDDDVSHNPWIMFWDLLADSVASPKIPSLDKKLGRPVRRSLEFILEGDIYP